MILRYRLLILVGIVAVPSLYILAYQKMHPKWTGSWVGYIYYTHVKEEHTWWKLKTSLGIDVERNQIELQWIDNGEVGERSITEHDSNWPESYSNHLTGNWDWMMVPDRFLWSAGTSLNGGPGTWDWVANRQLLLFRYGIEHTERSGLRPGTQPNEYWPPPITIRVLVIPKSFVAGLECAAREFALAG